MVENPPIPELIKIYELSESAPEQLLKQITEVRFLKNEKKDIPEELLVLSQFVHSLTATQKRGFAEFLLLDEYSWSFATPSAFGAYRSRKISSMFPEARVADISCGSGSQLIELGKETAAVGFEKDALRYWLAKINVNLAFYLKYIPVKSQIYNIDGLSPEAQNLARDFLVILCDSWREGENYSPDLKDVFNFYKGKFIIYELKPLERINFVLQRYPFLFSKSEIEYFGEGERCSRLTVYFGRGNFVKFVQHDDSLDLELSYAQEKVESAALRSRENVLDGFPQHDFAVVNRSIVDNFFHLLLHLPIYSIDKKRYVCEVSKEDKIFRKVFSPVVSSSDISEITSFLKDNYDDYTAALRFEILSEEYWDFVKRHELVANRDSPNKFSLFKHKEIFHLAEEK